MNFRRALSTVAVFALAPLTSLAVAPAAHADTPDCLTKAEFRSVTRGMTMTRVHAIFDTAGKQSYFSSGSAWYPATQAREYNPCNSRYGFVSVDYKKKSGVWVETSKYAYWG